MKMLLSSFTLFLAGCSLFSSKDKPDPHDAFRPHHPTSLRTTPKGHHRDAGPFVSVTQGFETEVEIDQAVDGEYDYFRSKFPQYASIEVDVWLSDDYVMWNPSPGEWCAGLGPGQGGIVVACAIWSRKTSDLDPGTAWIKRPPGTYFGEEIPKWRSTTSPLVPALAHELLHIAIGDRDHRRPEWAILGR